MNCIENTRFLGALQETQGRLTISNRNTHREIKLKFSALLKDYDLKYAENSKKNVTETCSRFNIS